MLEWFGKRLRHMQEVKRDERGFTLIELLVVVIIIGILAAIAIPVFLSQRDNAEDKAAQANLRNAASAQTLKYAQTGSFTDDITNGASTTDSLDDFGFRQGEPAVTVDATATTATAFCMSADSFKITDQSGRPISGSC